MFRKLLVTGGVGLLTVSALGVGAQGQEQSRAPVPTTPTTLSVGVERSTDTTTTTAATGTTGMAGTGPHDYVAWVSLAGVVALAMGASMRGRRADGAHWG